MVPVLDAPVRPDRLVEVGGGQGDLADIERGFIAFGPPPSGRLLLPSEAVHARGLDDQPVPGGVELAGDVEGLHRAMLLPAAPLAGDRFVEIARRLGSREVFQVREETALVVFHLRQQRVAARLRGFKGFF